MNGNTTQNLSLYFTQLYKDDGDFAYLARQLQSAGLEAVYDPIRLRPGEVLWDHISARITPDEVAAWVYLLTPRCLTDGTCMEELVSALDHAYEKKGAGFPLLGLLHGVAAESLPPALRLRPCVHIADPTWREQVRAVIEHRHFKGVTQFRWAIHASYGGDPSRIAVEVCPLSEGIRHWRFAVPASIPPIQWGHGPSNGGEISPCRFSVVRGSGLLENSEILWFGSEDYLSQADSAYVVFDRRLPDFVCFGRAKTPSGPPGKMEIYRTGLNQ